MGFGEDALQSVPGKIGSQDVNDVLSAVDHAVEMGLADRSRITVLGGSHGGFLTTHLIGQVLLFTLTFIVMAITILILKALV